MSESLLALLFPGPTAVGDAPLSRALNESLFLGSLLLEDVPPLLAAEVVGVEVGGGGWV